MNLRSAHADILQPMWQRIATYFGLREDPDRSREPPTLRATTLLGSLVCAVVFGSRHDRESAFGVRWHA